MIVILCNSFEEVQDGYDAFVSFLEEYEPFSIKETHNAAYCVDTDDDLRYVFIDYRFEKMFYRFNEPVDTIELEEFFEGIDEFYFSR